MHDLISLLVKWIRVLESDKPKLSKAAENFIGITSHFIEHLPESPLRKQKKQEVKKWTTKSMALKDIHHAANIMEPNFNGACLSRKQQEK